MELSVEPTLWQRELQDNLKKKFDDDSKRADKEMLKDLCQDAILHLALAREVFKSTTMPYLEDQHSFYKGVWAAGVGYLPDLKVSDQSRPVLKVLVESQLACA